MAFAEEVRDNFSKLFPRDSFQIIHAPNYCVSSFNGDLLLKARLDDDQYLLVLKLRVSSAPSITNDRIFQLAFPWVYESRKVADTDKRRDFIKDNLSTLFAQYHVLVLLFKSGQSWAAPYAKAKGNAVFTAQHGDYDIIVVLY